MKLVTAEEMKTIDQQATEDYAVPAILLMDQAAKAVAAEALALLEAAGSSKAVVFCGSGNNGGDGLGAARWLLNKGMQVRVFLPGKTAEAFQGEAAQELAMLEAAGGRVESLRRDDDWTIAGLAVERAAVLIDAMVGTGFHGELQGEVLRAAKLLRASGKPVVAVDIPTGVNADDGSAAKNAVAAAVTVTMALSKPGLWLYPGHSLCGRIVVADIGMPAKLLEQYPSHKYRLTDAIVRKLLPLRAADAHKGDAGRVLVCAGSPGYTGAAALASQAAVKAGAGLVSLYTPLSCRDVLAVKLTEVMVRGLLERQPGVLGGGAVRELLAQPADVLAIGPGLGISEATQEVVRETLQQVELPVVIDADALTALAGHTELLTQMQAPKVLTPHPGELARLTGLEIEAINSDRLNIAVKYAQEWQAVLVLKGAPTVIACPDGTAYLNSTGSSALATGGSGDVLTGVIAALAAQGISLQEAALCGVYLHGLAAELSGTELGLAAGELAAWLPQARQQVVQAEDKAR